MTSLTDTTLDWANQRGVTTVFETETGSTNDDAKSRAMRENDDLVLFLAAHQTNGRGRGANHWLDTGAGESLLSTWSLSVSSPPQAITGPRIGLALFAAATHAWPSLKFGLKAPNDLYLDGQKVAGLLVETVTGGALHRLIVGLGLNVSNHPRSLNAQATHLTGALGRSPDAGEWFQFLDAFRDQLNAAAGECLQAHLSDFARAELKAALNANAARKFVVTDVSAEGDLHHASGIVRWTDL